MADSMLPGWPRCLGRGQAAAYLGVSIDTFDAEVRAGYWPGPERRGAKGGRLTWDRMLLDAAQDRRSRLQVDPAAETDDPDPTSIGADAWKERIRVTPAHQRPQGRSQASR
jgi:hypothetical protein